MRSKKYFLIGDGGDRRGGDMKTIGAPIPHPSKPNDWQFLEQVVKAHDAAGPLTLVERGSPVPCNMKKHHTMVTGSKVPHIEDWNTSPFGSHRYCPICREFLCKGKFNTKYCELFQE